MDLFLIGLITGGAASWVIKDGAVWALREEARYWHGEAMSAEVFVRLRDHGVSRLRVARQQARRVSAIVRLLAPSLAPAARRRAASAGAPRLPWWPGWRAVP